LGNHLHEIFTHLKFAQSSRQALSYCTVYCDDRSGDELEAQQYKEKRNTTSHRSFDRFQYPATKRVQVDVNGLVGSIEYQRSRRAQELWGEELLDRAVLVQTTGNISRLRKYCEEVELHSRYLKPPPEQRFLGGGVGENILLETLDHSGTLCVGDELWFFPASSNSETPQEHLVLQIACSRRPCSAVDTNFGLGVITTFNRCFFSSLNLFRRTLSGI